MAKVFRFQAEALDAAFAGRLAEGQLIIVGGRPARVVRRYGATTIRYLGQSEIGAQTQHDRKFHRTWRRGRGAWVPVD